MSVEELVGDGAAREPRPGCGTRCRRTAIRGPARPPQRRRKRPSSFRPEPREIVAELELRLAGPGVLARSTDPPSGSRSRRRLEHCRSVKTVILTGASVGPRYGPILRDPADQLLDCSPPVMPDHLRAARRRSRARRSPRTRQGADASRRRGTHGLLVIRARPRRDGCDVSLPGDRLVVAHREPGQERLEALLDRPSACRE